MTNWAIVIGINQYKHHPERQLRFAVQDAQRLGKFLCDHANFPPDQVFLCLGDEEHKDTITYPTCSNLLALLRDLRTNRQRVINRLWFFFSGHGLSKNGRDYLITSDCFEEEIERFALPVDGVIAELQLHKDAEIVMVLDACRQKLGSKSVDNNPIGQQTLEFAKDRGIITIFSCSYGQYSYELETVKHGSFTYALTDCLKEYTFPALLEDRLRQYVRNLNDKDKKPTNQTPIIRIEPVWKAHQSLLPGCVTEADIEFLKLLAVEAERNRNFNEAKKLWRQVNLISGSATEREAALAAIEQIDRGVNLIENLPPLKHPDFEETPPDDWYKANEKKSSRFSRLLSFLFDEQ